MYLWQSVSETRWLDGLIADLHNKVESFSKNKPKHDQILNHLQISQQKKNFNYVFNVRDIFKWIDFQCQLIYEA